jgi:pilus assembly protein CpaB
MKLHMLFIVALGIAAAGAAAMFIQTFSIQQRHTYTSTEQEFSVVVAKESIPAMTLMKGTTVMVKKVASTAAPKGALRDPVQVVGKVLIVPVAEGEALTESKFAKDGSGINLASILPTGKRAVTISLNDATGMVGLLYPGSVVDVMISLQASNSLETVTRTLAQGVQVLAVGSESVGSDPEKAAGAAKGDQRLVTLLGRCT